MNLWVRDERLDRAPFNPSKKRRRQDHLLGHANPQSASMLTCAPKRYPWTSRCNYHSSPLNWIKRSSILPPSILTTTKKSQFKTHTRVFYIYLLLSKLYVFFRSIRFIEGLYIMHWRWCIALSESKFTFGDSR